MSLDNLDIYLLVAIITGVMVTVVSMFLMLTRERSRSEYNTHKQQAQLSDIRLDLEHKMREINERLTATQDRWSEINHLLLSAQKFQEISPSTGPPQLSIFLRAAGVTAEDLKIDDKLVFVLTPFHPDFQKSYDTILEIAQRSGLKCLRGDEEFARGDILSHILRLIVKARVVVANLEGRNPNVFYELGIAQAIDKPVILIAKVLEEVPFDVQANRVLVYKNQSELRDKIRSELLKVFTES